MTPLARDQSHIQQLAGHLRVVVGVASEILCFEKNGQTFGAGASNKE